MRKIAFLAFGAVLLAGSLWTAKADNGVGKVPVGGTPISIVAGSGLSGTVGQYLDARFYIQGGSAPYTFNYSGNIPSGTYVSLSCNAGGYGYGCPPGSATTIDVSGYPYMAGNFTFTFTVFDRYGRSGSATFTITINAPGTIHVLSPNGGETWINGKNNIISWQATAAGPYNVFARQLDSNCYGYSCGPIWYGVAYNVSGNSVNWNVGTDVYGSKMPNGKYDIVVYQANGSVFDASDAAFTITSGGVVIYR